MARGVNKAILVGRMGDDPSTKYTQGGMAVTKISLATSSVRKNREGEQVEETQWHRVTFFGKLAEIAGEYLKKGSQVYVEGSIRYSESDKDGVKRYYTDIIADEMHMLGGRGDGESGGGDRAARTPRESSGSGQRNGTGYGQRQAPAASSPPPMDDFDDSDIPFD